MPNSHLVIGMGEVGTALVNVLSEVHDVSICDLERGIYPDNGAHFDMAHICFPYSGGFVGQVQDYQRTYDIDVTVIHSTVPVGTSRRLDAVHSPVMGRHPHLEGDLLTITKFIGGKDDIDAGQAARAFAAAGMTVYITPRAETTELIKLLSTLYYGVCVEFTKEVAALCYLNGVPFEAWTLWNNAYNEAPYIIGSGLQRPNLVAVPGKIGGHCVLANAGMIDSEFADLVKRRNE